MSRRHRYTIPKNTKVDIQNLSTGQKLAGYITQKDLEFEDRENTSESYGTLFFHFKKDAWMISVPADKIE